MSVAIIKGILIILIASISQLAAVEVQKWTLSGSMTTPRSQHASILLSNGKVLVVGGRDGTNTLNTCEIFDPNTGLFSATGSMSSPRRDFSIVAINNGNILAIAGRIDNNYTQTQTCEIYNATTGTWSATGALSTVRFDYTATVLPNGKVLVIGGRSSTTPNTSNWVDLNSAEIFDPGTGLWTTTSPMSLGRAYHTATLLANGNVLVVGGASRYPIAIDPFNSSEIYNPTTNIWSKAADVLSTTRFSSVHTATVITGGNIIIIGGIGTSSSSGFPLTIESYDSVADSWSNAGSLPNGRYVHTSSLLSDGRILLAGGYEITGTLSSLATTCSVYSPDTKIVAPAAAMNAARVNHTTTILPSGNVFTCGGDGTSTILSSSEIFTYDLTPTFTTSPSDQAVIVGSTATFTIAATGKPNPSFQWQRSNDNGTTWTPITGATSTIYTTPSTATGDNAALFSCVATNSAGSTTSSSAKLLIVVPPAPIAPSFTVNPPDITILVGQTANFTATATGYPIPTLQWQRSNDGGATWTAISGATASTYSLVTAVSDNGSRFQVVATNSAGTITSSAGILTLTVPPTFTTQPGNQAVLVGQTATFTAVANGTPTYQWQSSPPSGTFGNITGATSATYTTPATAITQNGTQYQVIATNIAGSSTSSVVTLTVAAASVAPTFTTQPANASVTEGSTATFIIAASGIPTPTIQWQSATATGAFSNIAGATASSYTTPATTVAQTGTRYQAVATNSAGTVTSNVATLTVTAIIAPPASGGGGGGGGGACGLGAGLAMISLTLALMGNRRQLITKKRKIQSN